MSNDEHIRRLKDQIWTTRISRVNAEKRLKEKEAFIQAINIYYSCFTVAVSIILLSWQNYALNLIIVFLTIALLAGILYFKTLNYSGRAQYFRHNYTEMQKLEFRLSHELKCDEEVQEIEDKYCSLLSEAENHISYDYYRTLVYSNKEYQKAHSTDVISRKYKWNVAWRFVIKLLCILFPIFLLILAYWGQAYGWFSCV